MMTIVGVSAAGFVGFDPAQSPQIRVPILMEPQIAQIERIVPNPFNLRNLRLLILWEAE